MADSAIGERNMDTVIALVVSMVLSGSCFTVQRADDTDGNIVSNLEKDSYGGAYLKDDSLHIKPLAGQAQQEIAATAAQGIIIDEPTKYSMEELNKAMEDSIALFEEVDIDFVAIDEENNGLVVGMFGVTEAKMDRFCEEIKIDTILFEER